MIKLIGLLSVSLLMVGCQSKATSERFSMAQSDVRACQSEVIAMKTSLANKPAITFKSESNALVYLVVQELAKSKATDDLAACSSAYIAMVNSDGRKTGKLIDGGFRLGSIGLGLIGVDMLVDGVTDLAGSGSDSYSFRDVSLTNKAGDATEFMPGGTATMNTNIGDGRIQTLTDGSRITNAEKFQENAVAEGGTLTSPLQDDSGDGSGNEAGFLQ